MDNSDSRQQDIRIGFAGGVRAVLRLSGTGTKGATLRVYPERFEPDAERHAYETQKVRALLAAAVDEIAGISGHIGRNTPDLMT